MKICPKCNEKFDLGKFCKFCGAALQDEEQEIHCTNCGAILKDDAKFCPECGAKLTSACGVLVDGDYVEIEQERKKVDIRHLSKEDDFFESFSIKMVDIPNRNFKMLNTAVTQKLYEAVMGSNPSKFKGDNNPVENINWYTAISFCNKLSTKLNFTIAYTDIGNGEIKWNKSSNGFRLPTDEEWGYAAKGGDFYVFAGSDVLDEVAWTRWNSDKRTHPVAFKKPNSYGLYDMTGNVWEWTYDLANNNMRSRRGGAWNSLLKDSYKLSTGWYDDPHRSKPEFGFRIVRNNQ